MRILLWHGWLLSGTGSNIYAARTAQVYRDQGHDVVLLCQDPHPERAGFVDAWGTVAADGVSELRPAGAAPGTGRLVLLRPEIGRLLPVFVLDEYEGFTVKRFLDLTEEELAAYLVRNVAALSAAAAWHQPEAVIAGHAVPGAVIAARALGTGRFVAKVHGSDLEYCVRHQERYLELAREGLEAAVAVTGGSDDVLARTAELIPTVAGRLRRIPPGVEVDRFRPRPRREALETAAALLEDDPDTSRGRPGDMDRKVAEVLASRDAAGLDALAAVYDQLAPDPGAAQRLRALAGHEGPVVGYLGKLIPQKGVERMIEALAVLPPQVRGLVVGFGTHREWLVALVEALNESDPEAVEWLGGRLWVELGGSAVAAAGGLAGRIAFTGRLDHRYAPLAVAAMDILVVPSMLAEAFGMVAAEAAAAGALPLVARHSSLAEVADALEGALARPGLLSFEGGPGATGRVAEAVRRILDLDPAVRAELGAEVSRFVASEWTWERTAGRLLEAARGVFGG
ncbi:MAG TPA: glycosyltransferase [Actinomycetota bacterium]|nr:glycosyltransferase [Actinomycetota bacterium]